MIRETKLANRAEAVENSTVPRLPLASVMWIIAVASVVALRAKHCRARNGGLCREMRTQRDPPTGSRRKSFPWSGMVRRAKIAKWRAAPRLKQPQWPCARNRRPVLEHKRDPHHGNHVVQPAGQMRPRRGRDHSRGKAAEIIPHLDAQQDARPDGVLDAAP